MQPARTPLIDFANRVLWPEGSITLPVTFGEHPQDKLVYLDFLVIKAPSPYNAIVGRPAIARLKAIVSTLHLSIKFPTPHGVAAIRGDQQMARECYRIALQRVDGEGSSATADSDDPTSKKVLFISTARRKEIQALNDTPVRLGSESEPINVAGPDKAVQIGRFLPDLVKKELTILLQEYADIWVAFLLKL